MSISTQAADDRRSEAVSHIMEGPATSLLAAFDQVPNIYVFVKDAERRFVACSEPFVELMGCSTKEQILGRSDEFFSPTYLVEHYRKDDERVLQQGVSLVDVVELVGRRDGGYDWFTSTKTPARSLSGHIVGIIGVTRRIAARDSGSEQFLTLAPAVELICREYARPIRVEELARQVQMSPSHFNRLFNRHFATTPYKYLMQIRIAAACDLLATTDLPIGVISSRTGFYDTSHLTNEFRKGQGESPSDYRARVQPRSTGMGIGSIRTPVPLTLAAMRRDETS
ncbi:MAG: AraC family transcriptional regulator [Frondihabitans sp.]|nr:AraC family transcriptional regulator [Frondihabitans sp.]